MGNDPETDRITEEAVATLKKLGATDVVSDRGEEGIERVRGLTGGHGVHSVLECVGTEEANRLVVQALKEFVGKPE